MNALHWVGEAAGEESLRTSASPRRSPLSERIALGSSRAGNVVRGEERGFFIESEPVVKPTGREEKTGALRGKHRRLAAGAGEHKRAQSVGRGGAGVAC